MHKHLAIASLCVFACLNASAESAEQSCSALFINAKAPIKSSSSAQVRQLCFDAFFVSYDKNTKGPQYVSEKLSRQSLMDAKDEVRTNRFYEEARLPSAWRAKLSDYESSGYDRGHMAPAADMPNASAMAQSFSLANVVPQDSYNNRRIWAGIEKATRKFAMRSQEPVYVTTGPVYLCQNNCKKIGEDIPVPTHIFKLIETKQSKSYAYWSENKAGSQIQIISKQELQHRTGIQFQ